MKRYTRRTYQLRILAYVHHIALRILDHCPCTMPFYEDVDVKPLVQEIESLKTKLQHADAYCEEALKENQLYRHKAALADAHLPKTADGKFVCECDFLLCPYCRERVTEFGSGYRCKECRTTGFDLHFKHSDCLAEPRKDGGR